MVAKPTSNNSCARRKIMLVDLSIGIHEGMDKIPFLPDVKVDVLRALKDGFPLEIRNVSMATHVGTHMDAAGARHLPAQKTIDQIDLEDVCGPGVVIPVRPEPGQEITLADVQKAGLPIEDGDIVFLDTGFAKRMGTHDYHLNPLSQARTSPTIWSPNTSKCSASTA